MPTLLSLEALEADRRFVQRQAAEAEDDEWGTIRLMWQSRLEEIELQIADLQSSVSNFASVALIFDGLPVIGTRDIRLTFATDALGRYQNVVSTAYAARMVETLPVPTQLPLTGTLPRFRHSQLFIRDLARGSFGFILEEIVPDQQELFPSLLKEAVESSTALIASLNSSDPEAVATALESTQPRLVGALQQFAKVLGDASASARIVGDEHQVELSVTEAAQLSSRLTEVHITEDQLVALGNLQGVLPDWGQFEFRLVDEGRVIRGAASENLVQKYQIDDVYRNRILSGLVRAHLKHHVTYRKGRQLSEQWSIEYVEPIEEINHAQQTELATSGPTD